MKIKDDWKNRRRIIFGILIFNAISLIYIILYGRESVVNSAIPSSLLFITASIIGSYIFGATWDDKNKLKEK